MNPAIRAAMAAALAAALMGPVPAAAQGQGLKLQRSLAPPPARGSEIPTFLTADTIQGIGAAELEAIGSAEIRRGETRLTADRILYEPDIEEVEATGNVRLRVAGDEIAGPRLRMRLSDTTGIFEDTSFRFSPRAVDIRGEQARGPVRTATTVSGRPETVVETRGTAEALRFDGDDQYRLTDGRFTTCKPGQDDWYIEADELDIDMDREVGTVRGARLDFLGVPTPRVPWFDFSLSNKRKSGFLPPTVGWQNNTGFELGVPFYWNIAPNYDATLTPRYMSRRGVQLLSQFRFLQPWSRGEVRYEILPQDRLDDDRTRWGFAANSHLNFQNGWTGLVNYQKVSDDNYFRDLASRLAVATQLFLPQQALLRYTSPAGWWSAVANMQRFQTLQDPTNPVTPPYFREPQLTLNALRQTIGAADVGIGAEYVNFTNSARMPVGQRATAYPYVTLPLVASYGFVIPKAGVSATYYELANADGFPSTTPSRTVPLASVDTGLFFERGVDWFGRGNLLQTFEPRVYYLYVPYRDQSDLPIFDTSTTDFSFSQLFQENIFAGGDRIANANQISYAATSRLVRPSDGQEVLRAIIGQRYYFTPQLVTVPGQPVRTQSVSPLILGLSGRIAPDWTADTVLQGRAGADANIERAVAGVRYSPAPSSVAGISYRYTSQDYTAGAGTINTIDAAAQWPLWRGLYGVARVSYDIDGRKAVDVLGGLEYNADCWILRLVAQQFQTATGTQTTQFFVQLELNGVARIGSNPVELLRRSIPGYSLLNAAVPGASSPDIAPFGTGQGPLDSGPAVPIPGGSSAYRYYD